jgi:hypothetical protein
MVLWSFFLAHAESEWIDRGFIGDDDLYVFTDILGHHLSDSFRCRRVRANQAKVAATHANADDYLLLRPFHLSTQ